MSKEFTQAEYEREWKRAEEMEKEARHARDQMELAQREAMILQGKVQVLMDTIVEMTVALRSRGISPAPMPREMYPGGQAHEVPYTGRSREIPGPRNPVPDPGLYGSELTGEKKHATVDPVPASDPGHNISAGHAVVMGVNDPGHLAEDPEEF